MWFKAHYHKSYLVKVLLYEASFIGIFEISRKKTYFKEEIHFKMQ